jgi:hypothetical protein
MKKVILSILAVMLVAGPALCADPLAGKNMSVGLDAPLIGWTNHNDKGEIVSTAGINAGLGYSYRGYFNPVKVNQFNGYWTGGTVVLILPYVGIGADYVWENGFYAGLGTIYIFPEVHLGVMF